MSERVDIAVIGSGAAGIAAAVTAARAGCVTMVFDQAPAGGGTGAFSGLTTLCGLFDDRGNYLHGGFVREFAQAVGEGTPLQMGRAWILAYRPERFREKARNLLAGTPGLEARWGAPLQEATVAGRRIVRINGVEVGAVIDCSGTAEVARTIDADCLATDDTTQAPAVLFPLYGVDHDLNIPAVLESVLIPLARAGWPPLSFQPSREVGAVTARFTGRPDQVPQLLDFLRENVRGFEQCATPLQELAIARRAGRMIMGRYLLTGADVLAGRKFPDAAVRCAWPIEQWNAEGVARYRYPPEGTHYEIPARSLRAAGVDNLFMAGKTISADVDAIASARVMGCCLATGEAAALLAAKGQA